MDMLVVEFSRTQVHNQDLTGFLGTFGLANLPEGKALIKLFNSMTFHVAGYDHDPRELHCIPEVRAFYREMRAKWPFFLYFATLETDSLKSILLCCLGDVVTIQREGHEKIGSHYDIREFSQLLLRLFGPMNLVCERAGMSEHEIRARTEAIFTYFELPFDPD
jgi:hypothetical protein